ncbi:MAG: hypothetical protein WCO00_07835 [Rhodospirillaceae bacterium]
MKRLVWKLVAALAVIAPHFAAAPAAADAGVSVWIGDGCCSPHRHHHHPGWGRPVVVMPPPVMMYGAPPPVVYGVPPGPVSAPPLSSGFIDSAGRTCREYQSTVTVGGQRQKSYGTACLAADGSWRIMN